MDDAFQYSERQREVRFGEFRFFFSSGVLLRQDSPVRIGSRARMLLQRLAQSPGETIGYAELISSAWPGIHVDEANLRVQMSTLRRLLDAGSPGPSHIVNTPGRGYSLNCEQLPGPECSPKIGQNVVGLLAPLSTMIGRGEDMAVALDRLQCHRCLSIVGPGGIGKTRLAVSLCWHIAEADDRRICFVDLAPLGSSDLVPATIAATLGGTEELHAPAEQRILTAIRGSPTLLVLDNCEHVLEATAELANTLLQQAPELRILATSREPFLIDGEAVLRLGGLALPPDDPVPASLAEALDYPAIELLVDRAMAAHGVVFSGQDVPALVRIAQRLDGIPLAIELAASRIEAIGVAALAQALDGQITLLDGGKRSASPRHRTLVATLEWSFDLLSDDERNLLVTLSVFQGEFQLEGAGQVSQTEFESLLRLVSSLVTKSFIIVSRSGQTVRYRLLETTRAFCAARMASRADASEIQRRHAAHLVTELALAIGAGSANAEGNAELRRIAADVRAALAWGLCEGGDARLAVQLIVESGPLWLRLSMLKDYALIIERAIDVFSTHPELDETDLVWLAPSLHKAWYNSLGLSQKVQPMLIRAIDVARRTGNRSCHLDCLWAMFGTRLTQARYGGALAYAREFQQVAEASGDAAQIAMAHRIVALSMWRDGNLSDAARHGRAALRSNAQMTAHVQLDLMYKQGVTSRANMSNLLWLTGQADAALDLAHEAVTVGLSGDLLGLAYGLGMMIIPLTFWVGDIEQAESLSALLMKISSENDYSYWGRWGRTYQSAVHRLRHGAAAPDDAIDAYAAEMDGLHRHILATILPDQPLEWVTQHDAAEVRTAPHWCTAELQRIAALQLLAKGDTEGARAQLAFAFDTARGQGATAWALRIATNIADLERHSGETDAARDMLTETLGRMSQGAKTRDVRRARRLLAELQ
ncbi:winged helix-turn-helix domain-containing protein [Paracoccus sp. MBLB3053]|uniref:Winged helix-turn-helix domain-containing protein n=1 Tax=Paracoccus aurantius TaxID=3073814 RepID=A0ABU2HUT1_9RHOB|nr:winged helix-turn-helix domain-containing protein [Paracoccus sp. MBLB3053]MDS9468813.1 winged helix-turn-helix domain-containing protein [Paracoccus sp. MBLB3053]